MAGFADRKAEGAEEALQVDAATAVLRFQRAQRFMKISTGLLAVSLLAVLACLRLEWSHLVPYLMWNHVAVIAVIGYGMFAVRRIPRPPLGRASPRLRELFSRSILITALVAAGVAVPNWVPTGFDMGRAPDGSAATSHSWHASADDVRYFENFNRGPDQEISKLQYDELNRSLYSNFARGWVLFSFIAMLTWRFIALRWRDVSSTVPSGPVATLSPTPSASASAGTRSTVLVAGIWSLGLGLNLLNFWVVPAEHACNMRMPPEMMPIVLAMPLVFFGASALFTKKAPFISPWIASLIDERLGPSRTQAFMVRLKPLLLFSVASLVTAAAAARSCWQAGAGLADWTIPGFFISAGLALALMHLVLRWRGVAGV
ncbi:hypothetical protein ACFJGW_19375 [Burkholderiaceae bacterium UC74_6]